MPRSITSLLALLLLAGCTAAWAPGAVEAPADPDPVGRWFGRLSLYSAEINDLALELRLRRTDGAREGRAEFEITSEPGQRYDYAVPVRWEHDGAAVTVGFGKEEPGLRFRGEFDGADRIVGRLDGWGIDDARFVLTRAPD